MSKENLKMNKTQILAKIERNLKMLGVPATLGSQSVTVDSAVISCVDAAIQAPMGGIDGSSSPFLGIGVANPGQIKLKGAAGEDSVGKIISSELRAKVLSVLCGFANDVIIEDGDSASVLASIPGHPDLKGMGQ